VSEQRTAERLTEAELGLPDSIADYIGEHCPTEFPAGADKAAAVIVVEIVRPILADRERARAAAVALEQQLALATVLSVPRPGARLPFQLRRHGDDRWAICDCQGRRLDRELQWMYEPSREELCDATRWTLDEALAATRQLAAAGDGDGRG